MQLFEWLITNGNIAGININTLERIVNNTKADMLYCEDIAFGLMKITDSRKNGEYNNKLIKCVKEYFTNDPAREKIKTSVVKNERIECLTVRNALGFEKGPEGSGCTECLKRCLEKKKNNEIFLLKNKKTNKIKKDINERVVDKTILPRVVEVNDNRQCANWVTKIDVGWWRNDRAGID